VLVIGCAGAGKSVFAVELGTRLGLPVVHLDRLYWRPGWVEPSAVFWQEAVRAELARDRWILDGNYGGTLEQRLAVADTCVLLDLPRRTCLRGCLERRVRGRIDPLPGCPERLTGEFLRYVWTFRAKRRPALLASLDAFERRGGCVIVLRNRAAAREFLAAHGCSPA
jgi:adenylate kinase family enzyme